MQPEQTIIRPEFQAPQSVPSNGKYHAHHPTTKSLWVASAGKKLRAAFLRIPGFFPVDWPIGSIIAYFTLLGAGIYAAVILGILTSLAGSTLVAITAPALIVALEWLLTSVLKYPVLRDRQVASLRAFVAKGTFLQDAHMQEASAWGWRDWTILLILILCLLAKASILITFGAYRPPVELATNWAIAGFDFAGHASGLTTRIPCFLLAKFIDSLHRRRRLAKVAHDAGTLGLDSADGLAFREHCFQSSVDLRCGETDGHQLLSQGAGAYVFRAAGTLDDGARDAFIALQTTPAAQATLAKELGRIQLDILQASEMRHVKIAPLPSAAA